jgi:hypothetical protein
LFVGEVVGTFEENVIFDQKKFVLFFSSLNKLKKGEKKN